MVGCEMSADGDAASSLAAFHFFLFKVYIELHFIRSIGRDGMVLD